MYNVTWDLERTMCQGSTVAYAFSRISSKTKSEITTSNRPFSMPRNSFSTFSSVLESWNRVVSKLWEIISETATWFAKKKIQITIFEFFWVKKSRFGRFFQDNKKCFFFRTKSNPNFLRSIAAVRLRYFAALYDP